jgi:hypothetical protein
MTSVMVTTPPSLGQTMAATTPPSRATSQSSTPSASASVPTGLETTSLGRVAAHRRVSASGDVATSGAPLPGSSGQSARPRRGPVGRRGLPAGGTSPTPWPPQARSPRTARRRTRRRRQGLCCRTACRRPGDQAGRRHQPCSPGRRYRGPSVCGAVGRHDEHEHQRHRSAIAGAVALPSQLRGQFREPAR